MVRGQVNDSLCVLPFRACLEMSTIRVTVKLTSISCSVPEKGSIADRTCDSKYTIAKSGNNINAKQESIGKSIRRMHCIG